MIPLYYKGVSLQKQEELSDNPERPTGAGTAAGFIQNDGQIPCLLASGIAGGIGHQYPSILHAAQHDEVAGAGEMAFQHDTC